MQNWRLGGDAGLCGALKDLGAAGAMEDPDSRDQRFDQPTD